MCKKHSNMKTLLISVVLLVACKTSGSLVSDVNIDRIQKLIDSLPAKATVDFRNYRRKFPLPAEIEYFDATNLDIIFPNSIENNYNVMVFSMSPNNGTCPPNSQFVFVNTVNMSGSNISTGDATVNATRLIDKIGIIVFKETDKIDPYLVKDYLSGGLTAVSCVNIEDYSAKFNLTMFAGTYLKVTPNVYLREQ